MSIPPAGAGLDMVSVPWTYCSPLVTMLETWSTTLSITDCAPVTAPFVGCIVANLPEVFPLLSSPNKRVHGATLNGRAISRA
jgi:hypothetical protein